MRFPGMFNKIKSKGDEIMDVDFRYKDFNCSIIFGVLRWKPGNAEHSTLSACWPDEWAKEMLRKFTRMAMDDEMERRHKKSNRKWLAKAFKEEFTREGVLELIDKGYDGLKDFVTKEAQSIPNIDIIPGRIVEP